jgi:hypothetical protein
MKAAYGTVEDVRKVRSRHVVQIILEVPIEHYAGAVNLLDGQKALVTVANLPLPFGVVESDGCSDGKGSPEPPQKQGGDTSEPGELCLFAVMRCQDERFRRWVQAVTNQADLVTEQQAKQFILVVCKIESRRELDTDPDAAALFHRLIRIPYSEACRKGTV